MASINSSPKLSYVDLYSSFTEVPSGYLVGQFEFGSNGKGFRLVKAGASALVVGNLLQSSAVDTQFDGLAVASAVTAGANQITVTNGTTAVTANQFDGGTLCISTNSASGTNLGEEYTIVGHGTATSGSSWLITVDRPFRTAVTTTTSTVAVRRSPYSGVIQCPTTLTGTAVGVAIYPIPAAAYGWVQTKGVCAALSDNSTFAVGSMLSNSAATAGAVGVVVAATARAIIGQAMSAQNSTHAIQVQMMLD